MTDWLRTTMTGGVDPTPLVLAWRIGVALTLGVAVAGLYKWARRGEAVQATFLTTLVLLAALIAMATQIIGDNIARAFSLVGALSVVRFRTVVKDTQDTAFVIFAVVVGMSSGANHLSVGLVGLAVLAVASLFLWPKAAGTGRAPVEGTLTLKMALATGLRDVIDQVLAGHADRVAMTSASTTRKGESLEITYHVRLRPGVSPADVVAGLNMIEGVTNAELRRGD